MTEHQILTMDSDSEQVLKTISSSELEECYRKYSSRMEMLHNSGGVFPVPRTYIRYCYGAAGLAVADGIDISHKIIKSKWNETNRKSEHESGFSLDKMYRELLNCQNLLFDVDPSQCQEPEPVIEVQQSGKILIFIPQLNINNLDNKISIPLTMLSKAELDESYAPPKNDFNGPFYKQLTGLKKQRMKIFEGSKIVKKPLRTLTMFEKKVETKKQMAHRLVNEKINWKKETSPKSELKKQTPIKLELKKQTSSKSELKKKILASSEMKKQILARSEWKKQIVRSEIKKQTSKSELNKHASPTPGFKDQTSPISKLNMETLPSSELKKQTSPISELNKQSLPISELNKQILPPSGLKKQILPPSGLKKQILPPSESTKQTSPKSELKKQTSPKSELKKQTSTSSELKKQTSPWSELKKRGIDKKNSMAARETKKFEMEIAVAVNKAPVFKKYKIPKVVKELPIIESGLSSLEKEILEVTMKMGSSNSLLEKSQMDSKKTKVASYDNPKATQTHTPTEKKEMNSSNSFLSSSSDSSNDEEENAQNCFMETEDSFVIPQVKRTPIPTVHKEVTSSNAVDKNLQPQIYKNGDVDDDLDILDLSVFDDEFNEFN